MSEFKPTSEQEAILAAFPTTRVMKINAVSGAGKTSTLKLLANAYQQPSLLLAFNKAIADEASKNFPAHVMCKTTHSLAYADFGCKLRAKLNPNPDPKVNTMRSIRDVIKWFDLEDFPAEPPISARTIAALARDTVENFCQSADTDITDFNVSRGDIKTLKKKHEFDESFLGRVIVKLAKLIWKERVSVLSKASTTHDVYLKLWQLSKPKLNFDCIYVDESQDLSKCVLDVLLNQTCKVVYVGDEHQSIYAWRGAVNAMQSITAPTLRLSQSWRYGSEIASVAETILAKYNVEVKGNPTVHSSISYILPESKHTEIFRTNAGLLLRAEELIDMGISVSIDVNVRDFVNQVKSIQSLIKGEKPFHDAISRFTSFGDLAETAKEDAELKRLMNTALRYDCAEFLEKLENNKSVKDPTVILTTGHRSKGLEWDYVVVGNDFKFSESDDILKINEQELNLLYVAVTRARLKVQLPVILWNYLNKKEDDE